MLLLRKAAQTFVTTAKDYTHSQRAGPWFRSKPKNRDGAFAGRFECKEVKSLCFSNIPIYIAAVS